MLIMVESNRRDFISSLAGGAAGLAIGEKAVAAGGPSVSGSATDAAKSLSSTEIFGSADLGPPGIAAKFWINPEIAALPVGHWRKIWLDFHNSQYIPTIGDKFSADEWGDRLEAAHVNTIVVFAKDMHGYFYYPSAYGPVHRGLALDLLGAQVAACRKRNIHVRAYYSTTWDNYLAENHPEWLVFKRDRTTYLPAFDATPHWTALCLAHEDFVALLLNHIKEFTSRYDLDGVALDMPVPIDGECFCAECLRQLRGRNLDPFDRAVQHNHKHELHKAFISKVRETVKAARPACQVDFNGQCVYGLAERVEYMDSLDIEALPTAFWGYYYFPTLVRYTRNFGVPTYGLTGRFEAHWGDFGGLKLPDQLKTEVASIVANAARCDIGDQMPPSGRLDPAVYNVVGNAYEHIKFIEPYLDEAAPVTEAVLLTGGLPLESPGTETNYGLVKLMIESCLQFDVLEPGAAWERYALVVLGDDLSVDLHLASRLHSFVERGGALIVIHRSGVVAGSEQSWLDRYGFTYAGMSSFKPAYFVPQMNMPRDFPTYQYALYEGASQWKARPPATTLALLGEPLFQRSPEHYTSHQQTPFDHLTDFATLAKSGRVLLVGFPLGLSYFKNGYWVYRRAFQQGVSELLPAKLVQSNAPLSAEITLTHQAARPASGRHERYLVHIVNFSPLRHTPSHPDYYEDPIPLTDITVRVNLPIRGAHAKAVVAGTVLPLRPTSAGGVEVLVPRVTIHEVVALEVA
jgi:Hypothetical glycosyl hydrolase 6/Beta-galactosidase trimerisation domain